MSMRLKSISQYDSVEAGTLNDDTLFFISQPNEGGYSSYKTDMSAIVGYANDKIDSKMAEKYGLTGEGGVMDVNGLSGIVNDISAGNFTFDGQKTFTQRPMLSGEPFVTSSDVQAIMSDSNFYISEDSVSSDMITATMDKSQKAELSCNATGNLVIYGWLQDTGYVFPQEAWVAIYGYINNNWVILQVQPWPVTEKSSILQYVGFNIPVSQGLKLQIRTGFRLESSATGTNIGNTLTTNQVQPNTFIGYIIHR